MSKIQYSKSTCGAVELLKRIREGTLSPKELPIYYRRACVAYLRFEGYTQEEIAEIFKVHRQTIMRDEKANRKELARLVDDVDVRQFAGGLIAWGRQLTARAVHDKDYGLAWKIQRELVHDLQSLGYLPKSPEQHQLQIGTFVDLVGLASEQHQQELIPVVDAKVLTGEKSKEVIIENVNKTQKQ